MELKRIRDEAQWKGSVGLVLHKELKGMPKSWLKGERTPKIRYWENAKREFV